MMMVCLFQVSALAGSEITARCAYLELSWLMMEIACLASLLMDGKSREKKIVARPASALRGRRPVRVLLPVAPAEVRAPQGDPDLGARLHAVAPEILLRRHRLPRAGPEPLGGHPGNEAFGTTQTSTKLLLEDICANLIDLYTGALQPLVMLVTNTFPPPPAVLTKEQKCAIRYFLPLRHMNTLRTLSITKVL